MHAVLDNKTAFSAKAGGGFLLYHSLDISVDNRFKFLYGCK